MKKLLVILFIGINTLAFAQKDTLYYNAEWQLATKYQAEYYRPLPLEKKGKFWLLKDYYIDGNLQFVGHTTDENKEVLHGDVIWYYSNGRIQDKVKYNNGVTIGSYVPFESLKSRVGYTEDELFFVRNGAENAAAPEDAVRHVTDTVADAESDPKEYSVADFPLLKEGLPPITFIQKGKRQELLKPYQTTNLEKEPFTITFPGMAYNEAKGAYNATKIAVVTDYELVHQINVGMRTADTDTFAPATGMAMDANPNYLIVDAEAHNYLYYLVAGEGRLQLQEKLDEDILLLKYTVHEITLNQTDYTIKDFPHADYSLYLVIFIDKNKNEIIDAGELNKVKLIFE